MDDEAVEATRDTARPAGRAYVARLALLFCGGWAVIYADRTTLYPLLSVVAKDFHLSGFQTGLITGTYFVLYVATLFFSGLLAERFGLKRVLVLSMLLAALGVAGLGLAAMNYLALLLLVGLHGAGAGPYYTMAYSITIHTVPARLRGMITGVINGGMSLGLAAGLALAGPAYQATGSWRLVFLFLAVPTLAAAALYQTVVHEVHVPVRRSLSLAEMFRDPTLLRMNLAGFCVLYGWWVVLSWGPTFFQTERGVGLTLSGLYTLTIALTAMPSGMLLGRLSDAVGRKPIILVMLPLMAVTLAILPRVQTRSGMILALLAYGVVGKLAWDPVAVAWLGDYVSRARPDAVGAAVGLFSFTGVFSAVIGPPLTGWIRDVTGSLAGGFYVAAAVALAGLCLSAGLVEWRADQGVQ